MKATRTILLLALLAAGCSTKGENSALVVTKVLAPKGSSSADAGAGSVLQCTSSPGDTESSFLLMGPDNFGSLGVAVDNRLKNPSDTNNLLRTNSADFYVHQAVVTYEMAAGTGSAPAGSTPPSGGAVPQGTSGSIGVVLFPSHLTGVSAGSFIRASIHLEGTLLDGSTVKTSQREFLIQYCGTPGCAGNPCL
jgi:hypothetical protein